MVQEFKLKSFKIDAFGGVDCKYAVKETADDGEITEQDFHIKSSRPVHADLEALFSGDLTKAVAHILDTTDDVAALELGKCRLFPDGIAFAGKDDNVGLSITGYRQTEHGRVRFKVPRVKYLQGVDDVCAWLTVFADAVVNEVHAYLFEGKIAETEVFGE